MGKQETERLKLTREDLGELIGTTHLVFNQTSHYQMSSECPILSPFERRRDLYGIRASIWRKDTSIHPDYFTPSEVGEGVSEGQYVQIDEVGYEENEGFFVDDQGEIFLESADHSKLEMMNKRSVGMLPDKSWIDKRQGIVGIRELGMLSYDVEFVHNEEPHPEGLIPLTPISRFEKRPDLYGVWGMYPDYYTQDEINSEVGERRLIPLKTTVSPTNHLFLDSQRMVWLVSYNRETEKIDVSGKKLVGEVPEMPSRNH